MMAVGWPVVGRNRDNRPLPGRYSQLVGQARADTALGLVGVDHAAELGGTGMQDFPHRPLCAVDIAVVDRVGRIAADQGRRGIAADHAERGKARPMQPGRRQRLGFAEEGQATLLLAQGRVHRQHLQPVPVLLACLLEPTLIIVRRIAGTTGFVVIPRRWIVERTLGWLGRWRRLSKDYEELPEVSEAMVTLAMIRLMLHRLSHPNQKRLPAS